ncbi:hypothetical protein [Shewanella sp. S23-S33]|uniref:hypothetical protein n=1 Tax=Shewanella TaxID=22 RepID=UPI00372D8696
MILKDWLTKNRKTAAQGAAFFGVKKSSFNSWLYLFRFPASRTLAVIELRAPDLDVKAWRIEYLLKQDEVKQQ